jgi:hypothetical protein
MDLKAFWAPYNGAVSLTFDDGTPNQLQKVVPALAGFGLRGTFYLTPRGANWRQRLAPWAEVATAGHEIGNHTLSHICAGNYALASGTKEGASKASRGKKSVSPNPGAPLTGYLEDKTLADIERDILLAQERLLELAPHQKEWTFAYPCYCTHVGRGTSRQSYVPIVAKHFVAGRVGAEYGFANHPGEVDLAASWGLAVERMSGFEMIGLVEELTAQGGWVILVFHAIDGRRLSVSSSDFHMLLNHLQRRSDAIWTAPVVEVAAKIAARQMGQGNTAKIT